MLKMDTRKEKTDDWGSCKCGEITTLLSIGKKEFFLSCDLCDFRIQKLDLFIKHVYRNHLHVFTQANSRPTSTEFVAQHSDESTNEWNDMVVEEVDSKEHILDDFEKVVVDINEREMVDPIQEDTMMCFKVEELSEEFANEYAEELNPAEFLEDECNIERIEEDAALPDEFQVKKIEEQRPSDERRHFTLEFIKLYRALPGLWNVKNKYYHNEMIKNEQYRTLLNKYREMYPKAQLQDVKEMIKCLRLNYNKERRDVEKNGTEPKLYYYKEISFLAGTESHSNSNETVDDSDAMQIFYDLTDDTLPEEYLEAYEQPKPSKQPKRTKAYRDSADRRFHLEFIELYKSYPSLWDPKDPDYKDRVLRKINYKELLEKYKERHPNAVVLDVRKKINCLRTNYNHELKRFLNTGVKSKSYYFEAMSFLNNNESKEIASKEMENDVYNTEMPCDVIDGDTLSEEYLETCEETDFQDTQFSSIQNVKEKKKRVQQFTDEKKFILEFIDLYKSLPSLWNKNAPDYYDLEAKNINYQILLQKFNEHYPDAVIQDVKKKINILRTNYKKAMKRIASGQPLQTKCFYIEAMHFLQNNELESDTKATDNDLHDMEMSVEAVADDTQSEEYLETSSICEDTTLLTHTKDTQRTQNVTKNLIRVKSETFLFEFIALYESLPALWNVNAIEYCDQKLKKIQYQILLKKYKEMHPSADVYDVKKRIHTLRTNYRRELRKGPPHGLFYFDKLNFLRQATTDTTTKRSTTRQNSCLNDEQFVHLVKAYECYPILWDDKEIEYRFGNRRQETMVKLLQDFNKMSGLNLTKYRLKEEISQLKAICSKEKKLKITCKQEELNYEPECPYYEQICFLENHVPPYECHVCKQMLRGLNQYYIHMSTHDGTLPFKCQICTHGFKSLPNLVEHLRRHTQDCLHRCDICQTSYVTSAQLKSHMIVHTENRPHVCDICGLSFRQRDNFREHMQRHEQRPNYECQYCLKVFYRSTMFKEHTYVCTYKSA